MNESRLKIFDILAKEKKWPDWSKWIGQDNDVYIFKHSNDPDTKKPIAWVYRNRKYLTGLFLTKKPGQYSGDLKTNNKRIFLLFKVISGDKINIYESV
jgi:hypothetical protein